MNASTFFGYKCPRCNSKVNLLAGVGIDVPECPNCHAIMVPDKDGQVSAANAFCPHCKSAFGLVQSDKCPICGGPFSRMP